MIRAHAMPFGAEVLDGGGVRFRLWAPAARSVALSTEGAAGRRFEMPAQDDGWFALTVAEAGPGTRYRFVIDGEHAVPDPASRFQPHDVHGASEVIDPATYVWGDGGWTGRPWEETVLYELHVGTFSPESNYDGVARRLDYLAELGVTAVQLMPLADWPGRRNWGYDGTYPFAPDAVLGQPEGLKSLVDAAHARGLMMFLDVVYNHFGPEGNYLRLFAPQMFTDRHTTPWGDAINFDGQGSATVRAFFIHNALYWLEEFGFDGLRLDAVHAILDDTEPDILVELADAVHARFDTVRRVHLVVENDRNEARYLERRPDGSPRWYVAQWNDDVHHAFHVLTTGETDGYFSDFADDPAGALARALGEGFVYQGEPSAHRDGAGRGEPSGHLPPVAFVDFLQNHDQVGNRAFGERIDTHVCAEATEAALCVLLLSPHLPLLFMGQEWAARSPFPFFCDFEPGLASAVREGRRREFARFARFRDPAVREQIPDPNDPATFRRAVLDWDEPVRSPHCARLALVRRLLHLRHAEIVPRLAGARAEPGSHARRGKLGLGATWLMGDGTRLVLDANLGPDADPEVYPHATGRVLHSCNLAHATSLDEGMPAWSVCWTLVQAGHRHDLR